MDLTPTTPDLSGMRRTWGGNVRQARNSAGMTRWALAVACEVHTSTISRIESGELSPSDELRIRLAAALDTTVADLFPYEDVAA